MRRRFEKARKGKNCHCCRRRETELGAKYITRPGHNLVDLWECVTKEIKHTHPKAREVVQELSLPIPGSRLPMSQWTLIGLVKDGTLFGIGIKFRFCTL